MSKETLTDLILGLVFIFAQVLIFQHLSILGTTPDLLLVYLLWLATKRNRGNLILQAGALGFVQDALFDFWGLNMFAKTLLCFMIFNFIERNKEGRLLIWQIFATIAVAAIFHNLIFLALSSFVEAYNTSYQPAIFVIGSGLYTAVVGSILFVFKGN
ncbi:rod shape-determining protein MreD [Gracilimonas tropica]|uniref:rod shape-determining protein MreD n=1 Tax=Gracilimonas tropica TaxID=454600 RepID=UPI00036CB89A|nr:rod shape-determining protein MreD [Gracilimonas tropica]